MENLIPVLRSHRTPRGDIDTERGTIVFNFVSNAIFILCRTLSNCAVFKVNNKNHLNRVVFGFCSSVGLKVKGTSLPQNSLFEEIG